MDWTGCKHNLSQSLNNCGVFIGLSYFRRWDWYNTYRTVTPAQCTSRLIAACSSHIAAPMPRDYSHNGLPRLRSFSPYPYIGARSVTKASLMRNPSDLMNVYH